MKSNCFCYVVDRNYVLPALVSAAQLKKVSSIEDDVVVIIFEDKDVTAKEVADVAHDVGVKILAAPKEMLTGLPMYCARFFINHIIEQNYYENIIYVDADTQIVADVASLSRAIPPSGSLFATLDIMSLMVDHTASTWQRLPHYFNSIGINPKNHRQYINSGVLKVSACDWAEISKSCLDYSKNADLKSLKFPDQDILNLILGGAQIPMSFKWNYPAFFMRRNLDRIVTPAIIHYMSRPRPWEGPFRPWGHSGHSVYGDFLTKYPEMQRFFVPMSSTTRLRYVVQQFWKGVSEPWASRYFCDALLKAEQEAAF